MLHVALVGAGNRGRLYADILKQITRDVRVTAIAEPRLARREQTADRHGISAARQFEDWRSLFETLPDGPEQAVIIATGDRDHVDPACVALARGHQVLLEKPIAPDVAGIRAVQAATRERARRGGSLTVCHVLRYDPLFRYIREVLEEGVLGRLLSVYHAENVAWYHMAHSYVRGQWGNSRTSAPMILAKSCHDLDLLCWFARSNAARVAATAGQSVFTGEHVPAGAPERCTDGCPVAETCRYEAVRTYRDGVPIKQALAHTGGLLGAAARFALRYPGVARRLPLLARYSPWSEWPTSTITDDLSSEGIMHALRTGPYGRCVYRCDNDQPDHLEAVIRFESGVGASFRMHGQSSEEGRTLRMDGTEGSLHARFGDKHEVTIHRHGAKTSDTRRFRSAGIGHGTADRALMETWVRILTGRHPPEPPDLAVESHLLAHAIHESTQTGRAVSLSEIRDGDS